MPRGARLIIHTLGEYPCGMAIMEIEQSGK